MSIINGTYNVYIYLEHIKMKIMFTCAECTLVSIQFDYHLCRVYACQYSICLSLVQSVRLSVINLFMGGQGRIQGGGG